MKRPEQQIQRAVFQHFKARSAPGVFAFHPANGGFRKPVEAAILKSIGVVPGVPDVIAIKGGEVFALELKAKQGRLSPTQVDTLRAIAEAGALVGIAYGLDEALEKLEAWGLLRKAA